MYRDIVFVWHFVCLAWSLPLLQRLSCPNRPRPRQVSLVTSSRCCTISYILWYIYFAQNKPSTPRYALCHSSSPPYYTLLIADYSKVIFISPSCLLSSLAHALRSKLSASIGEARAGEGMIEELLQAAPAGVVACVFRSGRTGGVGEV